MELIVEKLGHGETVDEILIDDPHLTREQIYACLLLRCPYYVAQKQPSIGGMIKLLADEQVAGLS